MPYVKVFQMPGEFVITFPASYHQGFNTGMHIYIYSFRKLNIGRF